MSDFDHGVFTVVIGDDDAKAWFRSAPARVDDWMYQIVDSIVFHASDQLKIHAPGRIKGLVEEDLPEVPEVGAVGGAAGVVPDRTSYPAPPSDGSDSADYPIWVDQGSGVHIEGGSHIFPRHAKRMGPIQWRGREIFLLSQRGQAGQHFSDESFVETVAWIPGRIELAKGELYTERAAVPS